MIPSVNYPSKNLLWRRLDVKKTWFYLLAVILLLGTVIFMSNPAYAEPTIIGDFAYIDNRALDDIFGVTGPKLHLIVMVTDPGGFSALTGPGSGTQATSSNSTFPFGQPVTFGFGSTIPITGGAEADGYLPITSSQFPNVTGTYTFTVTNTSSESTSSTSHNLNRPEIIPLPTNLTFSDNTTTPTFSFADPSPVPGFTGLVRRYSLDVFDDTKTRIGALNTSSRSRVHHSIPVYTPLSSFAIVNLDPYSKEGI
jgi:hypothetical protein